MNTDTDAVLIFQTKSEACFCILCKKERICAREIEDVRVREGGSEQLPEGTTPETDYTSAIYEV